MRLLIISLLAGLLGGALGFFIFEKIRPVAESPPAPTVRLARPVPYQVSTTPQLTEAKEALLLLAPASRGATWLAPTPSTALAVTLTTDGLVVVSGAYQAVPGLLGASFDRRPFTLEAAVQDKGAARLPNFLGLTLLRAVPVGKGEARLKSAQLRGFDELQEGALLISFTKIGAPRWHRIVRVGRSPGLTVTLAEDTRGLLEVEPAPEAGAPLFDEQGALAGMVGSDGAIIPAELLHQLVTQYLKDGTYHQTYLGIAGLDVAMLTPLKADLPARGWLLQGDSTHPAVTAKSPAAQAGLQAGDVLVSFDGQTLPAAVPFPMLLQRYPPGTAVELQVLRLGQEVQLKVVLGSK